MKPRRCPLCFKKLLWAPRENLSIGNCWICQDCCFVCDHDSYAFIFRDESLIYLIMAEKNSTKILNVSDRVHLLIPAYCLQLLYFGLFSRSYWNIGKKIAGRKIPPAKINADYIKRYLMLI